MHTLYLLRPLNDDVKLWIDENVAYEHYQVFAGGLAVHHRYIGEIVAGLNIAGFALHDDFEVEPAP